MLKLLIADDERIIRETISTIINWKAYDIELVHVCKNGLEAYHTILDESPDIVLTDIKMPRMDGLQLIKNVSEMNLNIEFIILSGYGEFEYAKTAMQYGVKYYLLKPCNENQILSCVQKAAHDCYQKKLSEKIGNSHFIISNNLQHSVISSVINDFISYTGDHADIENILKNYEAFMDFYYTPYTLVYAYFLENQALSGFLEELKPYWVSKNPRSILHGIYVTNTLLLFYKNYGDDTQEFIRFLKSLHLSRQSVELQIESHTYSSLKELLAITLKKVQRFSMIYYINNFHTFASCNYDFFVQKADQYYQNFSQTKSKDELEALIQLLFGIDNINFCHQIICGLVLRLSADGFAFSASELTDWLSRLNQENDLKKLKALAADALHSALNADIAKNKYSTSTQQVIAYIRDHFQNQNLTLKFIAENELYMNVDYVSRKFYKDTGKKFSQYLAEYRIRKAQEYLSSNKNEKIQDIALMVGYGNNPQYFSQQFKKLLGVTPSAYYKK